QTIIELYSRSINDISAIYNSCQFQLADKYAYCMHHLCIKHLSNMSKHSVTIHYNASPANENI
ncbi:hypothetical protein ELD61_30395, partial [Klebsiella pneumoniae]|nr:hypothetical protein [Klebsiella pneumoniae]